jgi:hypothetical protein
MELIPTYRTHMTPHGEWLPVYELVIPIEHRTSYELKLKRKKHYILIGA